MSIASLAAGDRRLAGLVEVLGDMGSVVVAFSGGADSAFLAAVARDVLGRHGALCATAVSPSLAPEELRDCRALAAEWDLELLELPTAELEDPDYARNDGDRCFHCKSHLLRAVAPVAASRGATVVLGVNLDDLGDHRPGQRAAAMAGARFPLVEAGLSKDDVRGLSRSLGLRTWDKPAAACLASRLPYGTPVTLGALGRVAAAESALRRLGFGQLRVRHYGDVARLELDPADLSEAVARRRELVEAVRGAGYAYVTLDLEGFRSGNLNAALSAAAAGGEQ
ncbi:MAG: ATP-dependent sacrificial sulfur transferase LarE [Acidimicrobiales bacterium]